MARKVHITKLTTQTHQKTHSEIKLKCVRLLKQEHSHGKQSMLQSKIETVVSQNVMRRECGIDEYEVEIGNPQQYKRIHMGPR